MKPRGAISIYIISTIIILILIVWAVFAFVIPNQDERIPPKFGRANIQVDMPTSGAEVSLPFQIKGMARVFENTVSIEIEDNNGKNLLKTFTTANSQEVGTFGEFFYEVFSLKETPKDGSINLKIYWDSPKDGEPLDMVEIPLKLNSEKNKEIEIFFSNSNLDGNDCSEVFPVKRFVPVSGTPIRQALDILLLDPLTYEEKQQGYITSIPRETKINSINLKGSTLYIDFNEHLDKNVAGSCIVQAIESQIENTVYPFGVQNVVFLIDGTSEGVLQP